MGLARDTSGVEESSAGLLKMFFWPISISSSEEEWTSRQCGRLVPLMGRKMDNAALRSGIPTVILLTMSSSSSSEKVDISPSVAKEELVRFLARPCTFSGIDGA